MSALICFHAVVIRQLGGKAKLAGTLGLGPQAVTKWHVRGIPSRYWHRIEDIAAVAGYPDVTAEALERSKPTTSRTTKIIGGEIAA